VLFPSSGYEISSGLSLDQIPFVSFKPPLVSSGTFMLCARVFYFAITQRPATMKVEPRIVEDDSFSPNSKVENETL
jgi:hypothetical protein